MENNKLTLYEKLVAIQAELKAPKNQYNSFGKYKYRSCEDILEGAKPILAKYGVAMFISDSIEPIGDRFYVCATITLTDRESTITNKAYARESESKSGMDSAQITGAASSYARKYALNGLFLIDDTKDPDTDEYKTQNDNMAKKKAEQKPEKKPEQKPAQANPSKYTDEDLKEAFEAIRGARNMDELYFINNSYPGLVDVNPAFKSALNARAAIVNPKKPAN